MINPRQYQVEAVGSLYTYFASKSGNPVLALPTGTGKSVIIAMFLQSVFYYYGNQRVLVVTHVKELVEQNHKKLLTLWPQAPAGIFSAGLKRKESNRSITFCGIGSVAKNADLFGHIDLMVVDEADLISPNDETLYRKFINELLKVNPLLKVVGLTATPWRLGSGTIVGDGVFTDICFNITDMHSFNRLIAEGYLCQLIPKKTTYMINIDGVHKRGGEFVESQLQNAVDKDEITQAALNETLELGAERKHWLVFASGVQHSINIADALNDMGIPAIAIHSKMSSAERDQGILDFKSGKYRAAVNNNVLTTGFDFPAIDLIVVLRPTASSRLWVQMLGRGTRPSLDTGKVDCLVLDFSGNTRRLGPVNDPVIPKKGGGKGGGEAPVKLCGACATYNHTSARNCICCGAEFTFQTKLKVEASTEELVKGEAPICEVFKVDHITYSVYRKDGRPPMLKVAYYCGLRQFNEYVCIEHEGFAQRKARQWWKQRSYSEFPFSTKEAMEQVDSLTAATHLRVWVNKKYPEILTHCFDGTAFGAQEATQPPTTDSRADLDSEYISAHNKKRLSIVSELDDDIPF